MAWLLDSDTKRDHLGSALGYFGDDDRAPVYTAQLGGRRVLVERMWDDGAWSGPAEGRPEQAPDWLRAVCLCGWSAGVLISRERDEEDLARIADRAERGRPLGTDRYTGEQLAQAHWISHALAATSAALPTAADAARNEVGEWLTTLARRQPRAALRLARELREQAEVAERLAVAHGRGVGTSWEELATAAGTARQPLWRKYRTVPAVTTADDLAPPFVPDYQHAEGHPPYTVQHVDPPAN